MTGPRYLSFSARRLLGLTTVGCLLALPFQRAQAVPFASGLRSIGGGAYQFILNEQADNVVISRNVGGDLALDSLGKGRHTFNLGAASDFSISVSNQAPAGFTAVDDSTNLFTSFDRPSGLVINNIPSSPYFGTIYINQPRSIAGGNPITTSAGRVMGEGVYSLTADRNGVNLPTFAVPATANDPSLAKAPGISTDPVNTSSMYRLGMDDAGNLIASDWSNTVGGLKYLSANLTVGGPLLQGESGPTGGVPSSTPGYALHGSVVGEPQAKGRLGVDLVVSAMDEDMDADQPFAVNNDGNNIWTWNVGAVVGNYAGAPELTVAVGDLYTSAGSPRQISGEVGFSGQPVGVDGAGTAVFLGLNLGVTANAQYNAHFDKWYLSGARVNGDDSSSLVILTPEGAGGDGRDIQVDWASRQFAIDHGLDGYADDPSVPASLDPNNDIFRNVHNVTFSPDNTTMYLHRRTVYDTDPLLGVGTAYGAKILAVPLDANGLPIIEIDNNGTPADTSDDSITNLEPIYTAGNPALSGSYSSIKADIAGNLYFTDNIGERLEYFSLGGQTTAITSNNAALTAGAFSLTTVPEPAGIATLALSGVLSLSIGKRRRG